MGDNHSLSEKVFHKLQEDILSGKYAVDEELKEKTALTVKTAQALSM